MACTHVSYVITWPVNTTVLSSWPLWQGESEPTCEKTTNALNGVLRRLCCPKPASGKLDVNPEIYAQWKKGGEERKQLLKVLVDCKGDKAPMGSVS